MEFTNQLEDSKYPKNQLVNQHSNIIIENGEIIFFDPSKTTFTN
ncbi:hypothetical protein XBP1_2100006 [Xenorhabdus bovienii str. puntauvense]|uniref:Uncharacterized protein n=1 Tax=Xenorhabdus bovienii str. puntauvense TaxID=1398201 RepID=A0A077NF55_XENBV|nr:hypothetical protein XBP1_2100006 [Xenorhabdus bovienii str. puntauvense]